MHDAAGHQVETAVEARAGFLDRPVVVVLCVSMALAVVAWARSGSASGTPRRDMSSDRSASAGAAALGVRSAPECE